MRILLVSLVLPLLACAPLVAADPSPDQRIPLTGDFVPFGMCMAELSPADQVATCLKAGYHGLGVTGMDAETLHAFAAVPEVASGRFRIVSTLWWYTYDQTVDPVWLDRVLVEAKGLGMALWVVADWNGGDRAAALKVTVDHLAAIADRCRSQGVELVLYPHVGCVFETAEQALEVQQKLAARGYPEVRISIHLCHELKRGNRDRLAEVVAKVAPYLALASVSGANVDTATDTTHDYWSTAIRPLDEGTFDVRPFLRALADNGYTGPVELHTYALPSPGTPGYDRHLERSLDRWHQLVLTP